MGVVRGDGPLSELMLWLGIGLAVLGLVLVVVMLRASRQEPEAPPAATPPAQARAERRKRKRPSLSALGALGLLTRLESRDHGIAEMAKGFLGALRYLQRRMGGAEEARYRLPWLLMLGAGNSGKTTALHSSGLNLPYGRPITGRELGARDCRWWVFDRGIVLDLHSSFMSAGTDVAGEKKWRWFLTLLDRFRARRPLDGVIITLAADDLIGPSALPLENLVAEAARFNNRLTTAQRLLGFSFPVTVLITKSDYLRGFGGFWRQIPAAYHNGMFGWSSPFAPTVPFRPEWVNTAFDALAESLFQLQLELATMPDPEDEENDGMFLFPQSVGELRERLGAFLRTLFRSGGTYDPLVFRGFYFTGDLGSFSPETALVPADETSEEMIADRRRIILFQDLLERKMFLEAGLAAPMLSSLALNNRNLVLARAGFFVLAAVLGGSMVIGGQNVAEDVNALLPSVRTMAQLVKKIQGKQQNLKHSDAVNSDVNLFQEEDVVELFRAMTKVKGNRISFPTLPSSWFSSINADMSAFIRIGFDSVILEAMSSQMNLRVEKAIAGKSRPEGGGKKPPPGQISIPEYVRLAVFINELKQIEFLSGLFNRLGETRNLGDLGTLVSELFGITLPPSFYEHSDLFRDALGELDYHKFDPAPFRTQTANRLRELTQTLFARLFESGPLLQELKILAETLQQLGGDAEGSRVDDAAFTSALEHLQQAEALLAGPDAAWIASTDPTRVGDFATLLAIVQQNVFFSQELSREIIDNLRQSFDRYQVEISRFQAQPFGLILGRDQAQHPAPTLAAPLVAFQRALEALFGQSFMAAAGSAAIIDKKDPNTNLVWDARQLNLATSFFTDYDRFIGEKLNAFPAGLRDRVRLLAHSRLAANMTTAVARAQKFQRSETASWQASGEADLAENIAKFRTAAPSLDRLLTIFRQTQMQGSYTALRAISGAQASSLLLQVDHHLENEGLYLPQQPFDHWDGQMTAIAHGYGAYDEMEMQAFLKMQRERVEFLTREYAEPVLAFLLRRDLMQESEIQPTISRWQRIAEEVGRYNNRRPDSAIVALERFIRFDMGNLRTTTCGEKLARLATPERSGDFFRQRLDWLRNETFNRCLALVTNEARFQYEEIAGRFNSTLAGRFPFAPAGTAAEASLPQVVRFLRETGPAGTAIRSQLAALQPFNPAVRPAIRFLDQMNSVREMIDMIAPPAADGAPPDDAGAVGAVAMQVDFRVNRSAEKGANNVIGWSLESNDRGVQNSDEKRRFLWRSGEPIRLSLRWAKDAPYQPLGRIDSTQPAVSGLTASFSYQGTWALLRLIAGHTVMATEPEGDTAMTTAVLRFEVPTVSAAAVNTPGESGSLVPARMFVRLQFQLPVPPKKEGDPKDASVPKARMPSLIFPATAPKF